MSGLWSTFVEVEAAGFADFVGGVPGDLDGDEDELEGCELKTCKNRERPVGFNFFFNFLLIIRGLSSTVGVFVKRV